MSAREARDAYRTYRSTYDIAAPLPSRGAAAAQDHLGRNAASLQRHADRRVRSADRGAPAPHASIARDRGAARILAREAWICTTAVTGGGVAAAATNARISRACRPAPAVTDIDKEITHDLAQRTFIGSAAILAGATAVSGRIAGRQHSGSADHGGCDDAAAARAARAARLPAGGHAQRLDAAVAHERRLEGIPPRRRTGGARNRARA